MRARMPWRIDTLFAYSLLRQNLTELQLIRIATRPYKPFWLIGYPKPNPEANLDLGPAGTTYHILNALQVERNKHGSFPSGQTYACPPRHGNTTLPIAPNPTSVGNLSK